MPSASELKISPIGLDATGQKVLAVVVALLRDEGLKLQLLPAEDSSGHLVILDMETPHGRAEFARLAPGQVKLLLGGPPASGRNIASLSKPLQVNALRDRLLRICRQMQAQMPDSPSPTSATVAQAAKSADESPTLVGFLRQAREQGKVFTLTHAGQPLLHVSGTLRVCAFASHEAERTWPTWPDGALACTPLSPGAFEAMTRNATLTALDNLLWTAVLQAAPMQMPAGLDETTPLRLRAWPNFTRQGFRNDYFRIAATLARQAASCEELVAATGLERSVVIGFLNACEAVGLLEIRSVEASTDDKVTPLRRPDPGARRGLLARLAQRLGWAQA